MAGAPTDEEEHSWAYPWARLPSVGHPERERGPRAALTSVTVYVDDVFIYD